VEFSPESSAVGRAPRPNPRYRRRTLRPADAERAGPARRLRADVAEPTRDPADWVCIFPAVGLPRDWVRFACAGLTVTLEPLLAGETCTLFLASGSCETPMMPLTSTSRPPGAV